MEQVRRECAADAAQQLAEAEAETQRALERALGRCSEESEALLTRTILQRDAVASHSMHAAVEQAVAQAVAQADARAQEAASAAAAAAEARLAEVGRAHEEEIRYPASMKAPPQF